MPVNASGASNIAVTIPAGQSLSPVIVTGALTVHGIFIPASWTAASITFQVSSDGGTTFWEMDSVSGNLVYVVTAGHYLAIDPTLWRAINCFKIRSGTAGSPVNQVSAANLIVAPTTLF